MARGVHKCMRSIFREFFLSKNSWCSSVKTVKRLHCFYFALLLLLTPTLIWWWWRRRDVRVIRSSRYYENRVTTVVSDQQSQPNCLSHWYAWAVFHGGRTGTTVQPWINSTVPFLWPTDILRQFVNKKRYYLQTINGPSHRRRFQ